MTTAVFLGTPEAAVPSLASLAGIADVRLVLTRPDRPAGRNRRLRPPPVKEAACDLGLAIAQPSDRTELRGAIASVGAVDVAVVVAFGMLIPADVLELPHRGFLNVHFSLLPRWRGAAPVERAIMAGDSELGVSLMVMDEGLDTGPVVATASIDASRLTGGEATQELAALGAGLLADHLADWVEGRATATPQDDMLATPAPSLKPADRDLDAGMTVTEVVNRVRALAPDRAARVMVDGEPHQLHSVWGATRPEHREPGVWHAVDGVPRWSVADGDIVIQTIQPPGKRPMTGEAWLRGRSLP